MIISASRRTDIPALYVSWLIVRLNAGFCMVTNPFNAKQVRRVSLHPEDVDGIVFWSKNPEPLLAHMDILASYPWLLQYTINDYSALIEPRIPSLESRIQTFRAFSQIHGALRVNWRYDPILYAGELGAEEHVRRFASIAAALEGYTDTCTISFLDSYAGFEKRVRGSGISTVPEDQILALAGALSKIGARHGIRLSSCAEPYDLGCVDILHGCCIDAKRLSLIAGKSIVAKPDKNQRPHCGCAASVDIGRYGTCTNGCLYCYAVKGKNARLAEAMGDAL